MFLLLNNASFMCLLLFLVVVQRYALQQFERSGYVLHAVGFELWLFYVFAAVYGLHVPPYFPRDPVEVLQAEADEDEGSGAELVVSVQLLDLLVRQAAILDPVAVGVFRLEYHRAAAGECALKIRLPGLYIAGKELALPVWSSEWFHGLRGFLNAGHAFVLIPAQARGDHILEVIAHDLALAAPLAALVALQKEERYSRLPVYESDLDDIVGIVYLKDIIPALSGEDDGARTAADFMQPVLYVPETMRCSELLRQIQGMEAYGEQNDKILSPKHLPRVFTFRWKIF